MVAMSSGLANIGMLYSVTSIGLWLPGGMNFIDRHLGPERIGNVPEPFRTRIGELALDHFTLGAALVEPVGAGFQSAHGLL